MTLYRGGTPVVTTAPPIPVVYLGARAGCSTETSVPPYWYHLQDFWRNWPLTEWWGSMNRLRRRNDNCRNAVALVLTTAVVAGTFSLSATTASAAPAVDAPLEVTQSSAVKVLATLDASNPVSTTLNLSVSDYYTDLDLTAEVSIAGSDPGELVLDETGLTLTVTTEEATSVVFSGSASDVITALTTQLEWEAPTTPGTVDLTVEVTQDLPANVFLFPAADPSDGAHGHLYLADSSNTDNRSGATSYVNSLGDLWGLEPHLATITSEAENNFLTDEIDGSNVWWIGAQDVSGDVTDGGTWKWIAGPESNTTFWDDATNSEGQRGNDAFGRFSWWADGEPNNFLSGPIWDLRREDDATFNASSGRWNDEDERESLRVLVEYSNSTSDDPSNDSLEVELTAVSRFAHLMDYADEDDTSTDFPTAPDAEVWTGTGADFPTLTGLTDEEFATALNIFLALDGLTSSNVDTVGEVQGIIDAYKQLLDYAESGDSQFLPNAALYATLGFGSLSQASVDQINAYILEQGASALSSSEGLNSALDAINESLTSFTHLMDYADENGTSTDFPTAPDAEVWTGTGADFPSAQPAGMTIMSLTDEQFATALNTFLALTGLDGTNVDTLDEVQDIIDAYQQLLDYIETGSDDYLPDASLYETLGFGTLNSSAVSALNRRLLQDGMDAVGSANDLLLYVEDVADIRLSRPRPRYFLPVLEDPQATTLLPNTR